MTEYVSTIVLVVLINLSTEYTLDRNEILGFLDKVSMEICDITVTHMEIQGISAIFQWFQVIRST